MWVAKIRFSSKGTLIGSKTSQYKVAMLGFPLSYYYDKNHISVQIVATLFGKDIDKKKLVKALKKDSRVINLELNKDFAVGIIREPSYMKCVYNKDIIHVAPALISDEGYEVVTIGSFKREILIKVSKLLEEKYSGKLISIRQTKLNSISIMRLRPDLTDKQRCAIELAIKNGYYHSPRKIDVKTLAKLSKLSFSTYQVHLRKAEQKLIPHSFE